MSVAARLWIAGIACCAAVVLGGCGSTSDEAQRSALAALAEQPAPAAAPSNTGKPCDDPAPKDQVMRVLPRPGRMPSATFMRKIQRRGELRVGVDQNSLGLGYFNPLKAKVEGFDIDHAREVALAIFGDTTHVRYVPVLTREREAVLRSDAVDMVASAFSINCERRKRIDFSSVYYVARQRLLVSRSSNVRRLSDLDDQKVCATEGSTSIANVARMGARTLPVELRSDCLVKLQDGLAGAITSDDAILFGLQKQDPQTKIVGPSLNVELYGLGVKKGRPEFVRFINAVLARMRRTGRAKQLQRRWLTGLPAPPAARSSTRGG